MVQYPIGKADSFEGVIDLITMKAYYFSQEDKGMTVTEKDIPEEYQAKAEELREVMIERAAECDDELTEKFLEEGTLTNDEIKAALRTGTLARTMRAPRCRCWSSRSLTTPTAT